ncbi:uncharacterized protein LOC112456196 [Temnothorax curvispinosus]|uniref:Uncharacterized protein LOC112456196 n=1 Tax=Temnothorax curvispinosus TaxID=300111 RepID=A0A6J1PYC1_9HYME|nr:uncharacterized protein LOC112456196 [Temnothorax curvispinosus]XP_024874365.1 uncharacterized protein LOC112456196 [Temnothorax curvispinosus]XP_024874366.1 uncharacterized protein LOC112456196 [Temnothorax curvispinosus]
MMHVLILSVILGVCRALAEKSEYTTTTEHPKGLASSEDRFLVDVVHGKNTSELVLGDVDKEETKKTDKKPRTVLHRESSLERGSSCCGSKYGSNGLARPDYNYNKIPLESGRYPSQYGERHPIERYGWQTQGRPPGPIGGGGGRPGGGSGSGVYAGSQLGDRYGQRPHASETANRPSALGYGSGNTGGYGYGASGYGGYGRPTGHGGPTGGYGVTGTLADGDEFGPADPAYPDASVPQGNIHAQKAIALKALAGVALIGAAAALASNPVLLPIGIVTGGRRKRSETFPAEERPDVQMDYILYMLKQNLAKIQRDGSSNKLVVSPRCVARLTCEIQKDYLSDLDNKDVEVLSANRKYHLTNLIRNNVLNTRTVRSDVKDLINRAVGVASENESCDVFACNYIRKG